MMKQVHFGVVLIACLLLGLSPQDGAAQIVAGTEVLTGAGGPDSATNILYINESFPLNVGAGGAVLTYTNFFAASGSGMFTPFVAEPLVSDPATGEDYVIRAIGTTRVGGVDYTCSGEFRFPFHDTETFSVQDDWVVGFLSSDPQGESPDARSVIPFASTGIDGWLTYSANAGNSAPAIEIGQPILEGVSGTDIDAFGFREYQFNVSAVSGNTKPPLDAGGRVGEACPAPPVLGEGQVGAPLPLSDGTPDGWSGIPVLFGFQLPAGESVEVVRYYPADSREFDVESELYHVTPLIVMQEDGSVENGEGIFSIWEVGPTHTPNTAGQQEFAWGSQVIPDDGNLYHPAVLQWFDSANDTNGGVVAFGEGGEGMHFFNVDTTDYIPDEDLGEVEPELVLTGLETHTSAAGGRAYQLNFEMSSAGGEPGDFNRDGMLGAADINDLTQQSAAKNNPPAYDLTNDALVNEADVRTWVVDLFGSWVGDANLDGEFSSSDLVTMFVAGTYEQDVPAVWTSGDFTGDGRFNTADLVAAFAGGGYEQGPRAAVQSVPEPSSITMMALGIAAVGWRRARAGRSVR
jgi:hypothetical protein